MMPAQITSTGSAVDFIETPRPGDDVGAVAGGGGLRDVRTGRYSVAV